MKRFLFDCGTRDTTASIGIAALRVMLALMMLCGHGWPKLQQFHTLKERFYSADFFPLHHSATFNLIATIVAEVGASSLIILGLATRPAAFVLGMTMVVAVFGYHHDAAWFVNPPSTLVAKELGLLYLIPLIAIILTGAGRFSLDSLIYQERDRRRRRW